MSPPTSFAVTMDADISISLRSGKGGKVLGSMDICMAWPIRSSFSILSFFSSSFRTLRCLTAVMFSIRMIISRPRTPSNLDIRVTLRIPAKISSSGMKMNMDQPVFSIGAIYRNQCWPMISISTSVDMPENRENELLPSSVLSSSSSSSTSPRTLPLRL